MASFRRALPRLELALAQRYPGVSVEASLVSRGPGDAYQSINFRAPASTLRKHGLVPAAVASEYADYIDEFGTHFIVNLKSSTHAYVMCSHEEHTGEGRGRLPSQHADNAKTRAIVGNLLKRVARETNNG